MVGPACWTYRSSDPRLAPLRGRTRTPSRLGCRRSRGVGYDTIWLRLFELGQVHPLPLVMLLLKQMNEDDGESGDPVSRPRRRCVCLACSRLATPLALPRRPSLSARFALPHHVSEERTHACAADLHQIRCAEVQGRTL